MKGSVALASLAALILPGCAWFRPAPAAPPTPPARVELIEDLVPIDWRQVITPADQARLDRIEQAWREGRAAAMRFRSAIASEGPLLDPSVVLPRAAPSPGPYRCRVIRLGARPAFQAFKPFTCFVEAEGELLTMVKADGSRRPAGRLWPDGDAGMVFLGATAVGNAPAPPYGENDTLNVTGRLERVEPFRWRLAVPYPQGGSEVLELYELVPLVPAALDAARPQP